MSSNTRAGLNKQHVIYEQLARAGRNTELTKVGEVKKKNEPLKNRSHKTAPLKTAPLKEVLMTLIDSRPPTYTYI